MKKLSLVALVLFSGSALRLSGQTTSPKRIKGSPYTYFYRITKQESERWYAQGRKFKAEPSYFHTLVDSFAYEGSYLPDLAPGNYLVTDAIKKHITFDLFTVTWLRPRLINNGRDLMIRLYDVRDASEVTDAKLSFDSKPMPYDPVSRSYRLASMNKEGKLRIERGEDLLCLDLMNKGSTKREFEKAEYEGFIAYSKPKYLPGDTVRLKAYALCKGKPMTEALVFYLTDYSPWRRPKDFIIRKEIAPSAPGAYLMEFIVGDTLSIDRDHSVSAFRHKGSGVVLSKGFYLEDYQLDEAEYDIKTAKTKYTVEDTIVIELSAKDANGLPLYDAYAALRVDLETVELQDKELSFIPYHITDMELNLGEEGGARVLIVPAKLPKANARYKAKVLFRNSNNEVQKDSCYFTVNEEVSSIRVTDKGDSFVAEFMKNGKPVPAEGELRRLLRSRLLEKKNVSFPYTFLPDPFTDEFRFSSGSSELKYSPLDARVRYEGLRTKDSVFINLENPRKLEIYYEVFKDNKLVKQGNSKEFSFAVKDESGSNYDFSYRYIWENLNLSKYERILPKEKTLNVEVEAPQTVFPGQHTSIKMKVSDFYGKPVRGADVTALAWNSQFRQEMNAQPPDLNTQPGLRKNRFRLMRTSAPNITEKERIGEAWFKRMRLDSIHYYKLYRPGNKLYMAYLTISSDSAQFAPFIAANGKDFRDIAAIWVDDVPLYFDNRKAPYYYNSVWSFYVPSGKHTVRLRTSDAEYRIEDLEFRKGYKLEFSFDMDQLPPEVKYKKCKRSYSKQEQENLKKYLLFISDGPNTSSFRLWSGGKRYYIGNDRIILLRSFSDIRYEATFYYSSPVKDAWGTIAFKPMTRFYLEDAVLKEKPVKGFPSRISRKPYFYDLTNGEVLKDGEGNKPDNYYYYSFGPFQEMPSLTDKENGSLCYSISGTRDISAAFLINETTGRAQRHGIERYSVNTKFMNLAPGTYSLLIINEQGEWFLKEGLPVKAGEVTCLQLSGIKYRPASVFAKPASSERFTLEYMDKHGLVSGKVISNTGRGMQGVKVSLVLGREREERLTDTEGNFLFSEIKEGMYNLYYGYDSTGCSQTIMGLVLAKNLSPKVIMKVRRPAQRNVECGTHELAYRGKAITVESLGPKKETWPYVNMRTGGNSSRSIYDSYSFDYRRQSIDEQEDGPSFTVDGMDMSSRYHGYRRSFRYKLRRFFGIRGKSSFYRSSYSYGKKRKVRAKFGGGEESDATGWAYNEPGEGGYAELSLSNTLFGVAGVKASHQNVRFLGDKSEKALNWKWDFGDGRAKSEEDEDEAGMSGASGIRSDFRDYAWWQPLLFTDEKGEAKFDVTFPGNVTKWDGYAIAMGNKSSGSGKTTVKAYKTVMATLSTPRFLVQGDSVNVVGKALNYSGKAVNAVTSFTVDKKEVSTSRVIVEKSLIENTKVVAGTRDSVEVQYSLSLSSDLVDGEKEFIPVYKPGTEEAKGIFYFLGRDTTIHFMPEAGSSLLEISALDNDLDILLQRLKKIKDYEYFCNEQVASKLIALLAEKSIYKKLGHVFTGEREIVRMIKRLEKSQRDEGNWGWWEHSSGNFYMTVYASNALQMAQEKGYYSPALSNALRHFYRHIDDLKGNELAQVLALLVRAQTGKSIYSDVLKRVEKDSLSEYSRLSLLRIRQQLGLEHSAALQRMLAMKKESILGGVYWGEASSLHWDDNLSRLSALAYKILENEPGQEKMLERIRGYFLEPGNASTYRNTAESATILEAILPGFLSSYKGTIAPPKLELQGAVQATLTKFPYVAKTSNTSQELVITKKGNTPLYFSAYQRKWSRNPVKDTSLYAMTSEFIAEGKTITALKAGQLTTMKVQLGAKKLGEYVMIEIPIPAGCSYDGKENALGRYEVHREYFKNKVVIFCETLPAGNYTFSIALQPRYTGSFQVNPPKCGLMYFPIFSGVGEMKRLAIGQ